MNKCDVKLELATGLIDCDVKLYKLVACNMIGRFEALWTMIKQS